MGFLVFFFFGGGGGGVELVKLLELFNGNRLDTRVGTFNTEFLTIECHYQRKILQLLGNLRHKEHNFATTTAK